MKTREEEFRKDRTNGEDVMLLRFDQYISVHDFLSPGCKEVMVHIVRTFLRTNIHLNRSLI